MRRPIRALGVAAALISCGLSSRLSGEELAAELLVQPIDPQVDSSVASMGARWRLVWDRGPLYPLIVPTDWVALVRIASESGLCLPDAPPAIEVSPIGPEDTPPDSRAFAVAVGGEVRVANPYDVPVVVRPNCGSTVVELAPLASEVVLSSLSAGLHRLCFGERDREVAIVAAEGAFSVTRGHGLEESGRIAFRFGDVLTRPRRNDETAILLEVRLWEGDRAVCQTDAATEVDCRFLVTAQAEAGEAFAIEPMAIEAAWVSPGTVGQ